MAVSPGVGGTGLNPAVLSAGPRGLEPLLGDVPLEVQLVGSQGGEPVSWSPPRKRCSPTPACAHRPHVLCRAQPAWARGFPQVVPYPDGGRRQLQGGGRWPPAWRGVVSLWYLLPRSSGMTAPQSYTWFTCRLCSHFLRLQPPRADATNTDTHLTLYIHQHLR